MNVLIAGAAGDVGSIVRPAFEAHHDCYYYDLRPVPGAEGRTFVGDINDEALLAAAMNGMQLVVNLTMGAGPGGRKKVDDVDAAFGVNVRGGYRLLAAALRAGVRRFVYASSLSVYHAVYERPFVVEESVPADSWRCTASRSGSAKRSARWRRCATRTWA